MRTAKWTVGIVAYGLLALLNLMHPFIHMFEGGALDAALPYLNMWVMQWEGHRHG